MLLFLYLIDILFSRSGHVKISDFGSSVQFTDDTSDRNSFVGTQDYVSPEVLTGEGKVTKSSDLWAVGCIIYQMLSGTSPFRTPTEYGTFEVIMGYCRGKNNLPFPIKMTSESKNIISSLLKFNGEERLGAGEVESDNNYQVLKSHPFFQLIPWGDLINQTAPYQPDPKTFPSTENMRDAPLEVFDFEEVIALDMDEEIIEPEKDENCLSTNNQQWIQFMRESECLVFSSVIYKRVVSL